jgi:hypothetical protein
VTRPIALDGDGPLGTLLSGGTASCCHRDLIAASAGLRAMAKSRANSRVRGTANQPRSGTLGAIPCHVRPLASRPFGGRVWAGVALVVAEARRYWFISPAQQPPAGPGQRARPIADLALALRARPYQIRDSAAFMPNELGQRVEARHVNERAHGSPAGRGSVTTVQPRLKGPWDVATCRLQPPALHSVPNRVPN